MNLEPFLRALPKINSPFTLSAFGLIILAFFLIFLSKTKGAFFHILKDKLTKKQTYKIIRITIVLCFLLAIIIYGLGYFHELRIYLDNRAKQTSIILNDSAIDILDLDNNVPVNKSFFISTDPPVAFPYPHQDNWEKPIFATNKEEVKRYLSIAFPKEIDFDDPFFELLNNPKMILIPSKSAIEISIVKGSILPDNDIFEKADSLDYPFDEPIKISSRDLIGIISFEKGKPDKSSNVFSMANILVHFIKALNTPASKIISTNTNCIFSGNMLIKKALINGIQKDLEISKYYRITETKSRFYIVEAGCYEPSQKKEILDYIIKVISEIKLDYN